MERLDDVELSIISKKYREPDPLFTCKKCNMENFFLLLNCVYCGTGRSSPENFQRVSTDEETDTETLENDEFTLVHQRS